MRDIYQTRVYTVPVLKDIIVELDANPTSSIALGGQFLTDGKEDSCDHKWIPWWNDLRLHSFLIAKNSSIKSLLNYQ